MSPRRDGDIAVCYSDPTKARVLLGWEAKLGLDKMCADAWRFIERNPDGLQDI
jgi:UDP-glucose 4-epimerase